MKTTKGWIKIIVLILLAVSLVSTGCCKKKAMMETTPTAKSSQGMSEEELAAQRMAEERAKREAMMKQAATQKFVNEDVHFAFDDSSIRPDAQEILKEKVEYMNANPDVTVTIEGHCDERGTEAYNMALGERRAQSVKAFMVNAGIDASRMQTISYGEEKPIDPGHNEAAWAKNRRCHFSIN